MEIQSVDIRFIFLQRQRQNQLRKFHEVKIVKMDKNKNGNQQHLHKLGQLLLLVSIRNYFVNSYDSLIFLI
jgi:hypothetical protein